MLNCSMYFCPYDPTTQPQGNLISEQYRSVIYYFNDAQRVMQEQEYRQ